MTRRAETVIWQIAAVALMLWIAPLIHAAEKSSSLLFNPTRELIYSANFDAGSVSVIDRKSGAIILEKPIGKDIRRIALGDDGKLLLASDYLGDKLVLLNASDLSLVREIKTPSRPFAVLYDAQHNQFYATSFEQAKLLRINHAGDLLDELDTIETPRGMALSDDGRLLVTHALTGQVSIYQTRTPTPELDKVIQLADTAEDNSKTVPQGRPRLLDNIAISPDGDEAWLPHVLWSFGHDFQFQSTVFPAVSIVDLTPGEEAEQIEERKLLFNQINIVESGNRTRIVSNPHDVVFSGSSKKVVISLAGSEDLMVFDLSREGKRNKNRHRRKKFQGGVKATQIYRNVPGNNPRGLLVDERDLYVQNAMSLDMVRFDTGNMGPFAKVKLADEVFARLVQKDPLPPQLRLGKTLFNSGNTLDYPASPMAGDFWMSCNSCHLDGFNFTNRQLMKDGQKNRFENAVTGHVDTRNMIAGDPVGAYIDIIQKTQGGMAGISVEQPPLEVAKLMTALNAYVKTPENLPYLSTWLRFEDETPYSHPEQWINSAKCNDCHSTIYDQWADSNHGMNMDHPFYRYQEDIAAESEGEDFRVLCRGCHAPQTVINNDKAAFSEYGDMYETNGQSLHAALEQGKAVSERGTGCVFCHRISKLENAGGNTDLSINLKDRDSYLFETASNPVLQWFAEKQINAEPEAHAQSYSNPEMYQSSLYCASCHNEFTPGMGASINDNYGEWLASPFNRPEDPAKHKTCIDCHMTQDVTDFDNKVAGQSTNDGPVKPHMRTHQFVGGNYYFTGMRNPEHKQLSIDILKTALKLEVEKHGQQFIAKVTNANSGHDMPGGSRRQVWLEVIAKDAKGEVVFQSGVMDKGVIPKDSRRFIKIGVDKHGEPVGIRFWRYVKIGQDTRIKSGETRREVFELPENIHYPLSISTRVLYQVFSKALVDKVQAAFPDQQIPEPEVIELQSLSRAFEQ